MWRNPPFVVEICGAFDRFTCDSFYDDMFCMISECPNCGGKSIKHVSKYEILNESWVNHRQIIDWLVERGAVIEVAKCKHCNELMEVKHLCEECRCCQNVGTTVFDDHGCCSCEWDDHYPRYAKNRGKKNNE